MTTTMAITGEKALSQEVQCALEKAGAYAHSIAHGDGHWCGETGSNVTMTAEYVMLMFALGTQDRLNKDAIIRWMLSDQREDGSWSLAYDVAGDISMTVEAYFALKLFGVSIHHPAMEKARLFALSAGGVAKVRMLTRVTLATFGLFPWTAVPEMPAELILAPNSAFLNIYRLSSWARAIIVPLLVVRHHRPIYTIPNGTSSSNDYLDELWCNPANKNEPYAPKSSEFMRLGLWAIDYTLHNFGGILRLLPTRNYAIQKYMSWILDHQDEEGDWAGIYPAKSHSLLALQLEGYSVESSPMRRGLEALERFCWRDAAGERMQASVSPVWDTVLMTVGLCDAGLPASRPYTKKSMMWVKSRQILKTRGDWHVYRPSLQPGGFCFQYYNRYYPDLDDTAATLLALVKEDSHSVHSTSVLRATEFLLELQNTDGGWGAYEVDNNSLWLNKIPFSDMDCLCDPATADITGRVLEAWGLILEQQDGKGDGYPAQLIHRIRHSADKAITFLAANQEIFGGWYGRWGVNYIYGTSNCVQLMVPPAIHWLKSVQNPDGGWGESVDSYKDIKLAGQGPSTPSQTAWALMGLIAFLPSTDNSVLRGVDYLLRTQAEVSGKGKGASWNEDHFTGVGFPNWFYMKYELYPHSFPMMALGRWAAKARNHHNPSSTPNLPKQQPWKWRVNVPIRPPASKDQALAPTLPIPIPTYSAHRINSSHRRVGSGSGYIPVLRMQHVRYCSIQVLAPMVLTRSLPWTFIGSGLGG
ncbi:terpene cyclase/mutase family protein [Aspergillus stella-maris]|uniref:terpene cyclase/mutase family protein n=1 Tax=Aspergillus stella-maris TaxID=1810926 RepID=UPI003CCD3632